MNDTIDEGLRRASELFSGDRDALQAYILQFPWLCSAFYILAVLLLLIFAADIIYKTRFAVKIIRHAIPAKGATILDEAELEVANKPLLYKFYNYNGGEAIQTAKAEQAEE